ncbi:MAG: DMT family transporter [Panacibacter sp.]
MQKLIKLGRSFTGWLLFILISLIWGSSFILMKIGLQSLTAYQVATIRILSASIVLMPFAYKAFKNVEKKKVGQVILSGLLGSFFPAFLYCIAETKIDSSLAAILNSLTPMFAIIAGVSFFKLKAGTQKIKGVVIGFLGLALLPFTTQTGIDLKDLQYALLVLLATICYALNVNMVNKNLHDISSLHIASLAFSFLLLPALIILIATGYFNLPLTTVPYIKATLAAAILGTIGTAIASVLFYMLLKQTGVLFTSLVTYAIPIVAVMWGLLYGESITLAETGCLAIILSGVYLVNKKEKVVDPA